MYSKPPNVGGWNDKSCSALRGYVCQAPRSKCIRHHREIVLLSDWTHSFGYGLWKMSSFRLTLNIHHGPRLCVSRNISLCGRNCRAGNLEGNLLWNGTICKERIISKLVLVRQLQSTGDVFIPCIYGDWVRHLVIVGKCLITSHECDSLTLAPDQAG